MSRLNKNGSLNLILSGQPFQGPESIFCDGRGNNRGPDRFYCYVALVLRHQCARRNAENDRSWNWFRMCGIAIWGSKTLIRRMSIADETTTGADGSEEPNTHRTSRILQEAAPDLSGSDMMIFENWLKAHLCKVYQEVLGEPLPQDLCEIVEKMGAGGQPTQDGQKPSTIAPRSMAQVP